MQSNAVAELRLLEFHQCGRDFEPPNSSLGALRHLGRPPVLIWTKPSSVVAFFIHESVAVNAAVKIWGGSGCSASGKLV